MRVLIKTSQFLLRIISVIGVFVITPERSSTTFILTASSINTVSI